MVREVMSGIILLDQGSVNEINGGWRRGSLLPALPTGLESSSYNLLFQLIA